MKKTLAKLMATAGALSLLASAIPFAGVSAEEAEFKYDVVDGGGVVITEWNDTTAEEVTVPATVTVGEDEFAVVGIADYAFGLCEDLAVINVPDSLKLDNMGNTAFLTAPMVMDYIDAELADTASTDEILTYIATKADYKGGNWTDADIAELSVKLNNHLNKVDISAAKTVEGKIMTLIMNIDDMGFSQTNLDKFGLWIATAPYTGLTLQGNAGTEIETYANGKNIAFVSNNYILGDANGDGKFNVRDASWVARQLATGATVTAEENPAADYNGDGKVNVRDAAAMARDLATAKG